MRITLRVLPYLKPNPWLALSTVLTVVLVALAGLLAPWPLKILIDNVVGDQPLPGFLDMGFFSGDRFHMMIAVVTAGFGLVLLQNILNVLREYLNTRLKLKMTLNFRGDLFQHAQRLSLAYHDNTYSGKLVYLLNNQADGVAGLLMTVPVLAQSMLTLIGMFWVLIVMDYQLALASLVVLPFLVYSVSSYASRIHAPLNEVKDLEAQTLSLIQESMSMLRVIVAFGRENYEWLRFRTQGENALDARVKVTVRQTIFGLSVNLITAAGNALVIGLGAAHILRGELTVGELIVVIAYIAAVYQSLGAISSTVGALQDQVVSLERAFELLDTRPDVSDTHNAKEFSKVDGEIEFQNVSFSYDTNAETLIDISVRIHPGEYVAIVGPTGAGKTTLVNLIPRFYDPASGQVRIDGKNIRDFSLKSLREQISIVGQEPILFRGSILDNIRYGRLQASEAEIVKAAKSANAHDFIMRLPEQYGHQVGERGAGLSGGERQRIAVARAFLKDAPVLILDEPTAFIDIRTEAVVLDALARLRKGRTTVMISHRIATIRDADRILVLDEGRIVECGTHAELKSNHGLYQQFNQIQAEQGNDPR